MSTQPNPNPSSSPELLLAGLRMLRKTRDPDSLSPGERLAVVEWLHRHPAEAHFDPPCAGLYAGFKPSSLEVMRCTRRPGPRWIRCGRMIRYRKADLDAYLSAQTVDAKDSEAS